MINKDAFEFVFNYLPEEALYSLSQVSKASCTLVSEQCQKWIAKQSVDHDHLQPHLAQIANNGSLLPYFSTFLPSEWLAFIPSDYLQNIDAFLTGATNEKIDLKATDYQRAALNVELLISAPYTHNFLLSFENFGIHQDIEKLLSVTPIADESCGDCSPEDQVLSLGVSAEMLLKEAQFLVKKLQKTALSELPSNIGKVVVLKVYKHLDAVLKSLVIFMLIGRVSSEQEIPLITHPVLNPWISGFCLVLLTRHSSNEGLLKRLISDLVSSDSKNDKAGIEQTLSRLTDYDWEIILLEGREHQNGHDEILLGAIEANCLPVINNIGGRAFTALFAHDADQKKLMRFQANIPPEKLLMMLEYLPLEQFQIILESCQLFWMRLLNSLTEKQLLAINQSWHCYYVCALLNSEVFLQFVVETTSKRQTSVSQYLLNFLICLTRVNDGFVPKQVLQSEKFLSCLVPQNIFEEVQRIPSSNRTMQQDILRDNLIALLKKLSECDLFKVNDWLEWCSIFPDDVSRIVDSYCQESAAIADFLCVANAALYNWRFQGVRSTVIDRLEKVVWQSEENLKLALTYVNVARWLAENKVEKLTDECLKLIQSMHVIGQDSVELLSAALVEESKRNNAKIYLEHNTRLAEIKRQHDQRIASIELERYQASSTQESPKIDITFHHPEKKSNQFYYVGGVLILLIIFSVFLLSVGVAAVFNDQGAINITTKLFGYWGGDAVVSALIVGFLTLLSSLGVGYYQFVGCAHSASQDTQEERTSNWLNPLVESTRPGYLPIQGDNVFANGEVEESLLQAEKNEAIHNCSV